MMSRFARCVRPSGAVALFCFALCSAGCATPSPRTPSGAAADPGGSAPTTATGRLPVPGHRRRPAGPAQDRPEIEPHVVAHRDYRDPLLPFNRVLFTVNDALYRYMLIPVSRGYLWLVPDPVERSIGNFFQNLRTPLSAVNHLLQLQPGRMSTSTLRFAVNSTLGLLGLFDPATAWFGLEHRETGFDDTLAYYGLGYGLYLVLPLFGPSDLRDAANRVGSYFLSPIPYLTDEPVTTGLQGFDTLQDFAPAAENYRVLRRQSEDPYIFFRNLYLQGVQRDAAYTP
ncbi:MAG: VacJ family lipoprotein [Candidatus Marinimicrobia bacterium]|nr:VacJ family lipoprotein [Candidatus Neomarinimicrobiota bacterium]